MAIYTWRNTSSGFGGQFDLPSNWSNPSETISSTVPSAGDTATLNGGGGAISGTGSVDTIAFTAAAWSIAGQLTANTVTLDYGSLSAVGSSEQLVVNGAIQVGLLGSAALNLVNGGSIAVTGSAATASSNFGAATLTLGSRSLANFGSVNFGVNNAAASAVVDASVLAIGGILQLGVAGSGTLAITGGGAVVLSAATDTTTPYLKLGALANASGTLTVDGANSLLLLASNSGAVGYRGTGTLTVTNGASARFNASASSSNNALNPALTIGLYGIGTVTIAGSSSLLAAGGSIIVGSAGQGTLRVQGGAMATSVGFVAGQAALAVGTSGGGNGTVTIDGSGSALTASGAAIVGGDNRGSGLTSGGTGAIIVSNGGALQTGDATILAGSSIRIDGASWAGMSSLVVAGTISSAGTLAVNGAVYGGGTVTIGGGIADFGSLGTAGAAAATVSFASATATVRLHGVVGANTITSMQLGDTIDLVGIDSNTVRLAGTVVTTTTGTIALSAAPTGSHYQALSDGAGGTDIALSLDTIGVYRFFDSNYGTHFFSASGSEKNTIIGTRPDLVYEGVGLQSIDPASSDPHRSDVYRFFDTTYGTHFFTASSDERNTVMSTRSDLVYEGTGFYEHTAQQTGDTAVYRFFDTKYGTHFYTADASERATIVATRPDLVDEGTGFYAPTM